MPNDRDEREESRFKIIDNRMLSDDERAGKIITSNSPQNEDTPTPKLEVIGGGQSHLGASSLHEEPGQAVSAPSAFGDAADATETVPTDGYEIAEDEAPLSQEEAQQMREQIEQEQFAALEQQFGRALTENEKEQVRALMDKQAESMTNLEVAPLLLQTVSEIPRFAAVHLGLVPNPYTGIITRNDAEARLAIDAFGALYEVLKTRLDARTSGELARVLNDLRVNYTRITGINFAPTGGLGGPRIIR
ncbi:MAG: DUF1844 domain-containing protein [Armatimonadetes bacterium]|nr:DUF1844 domain-containing protein [Armatimonadota bacterium]